MREPENLCLVLFMVTTTEIYVRLLDEGADVSRPTQALYVGRGLYKVLPVIDCNSEDEVWEFPPGSLVRLTKYQSEGEEILLAVAPIGAETKQRELTGSERALLIALAPDFQNYLDHAQVADMQDGGMGSIRFLAHGERRRSRSICEAEYLDGDGVLVSIELNVDDDDRLFELDFWKVDFSPLCRYPEAKDLKRVVSH